MFKGGAAVSAWHRDSLASANVACAAYGWLASRRFVLAMHVWLWVKRLVRANMADDARALVRESCKGESFAQFGGLFATHFVAQQRTRRSVCGGTVGWGKGLRSGGDRSELHAVHWKGSSPQAGYRHQSNERLAGS